MTGLKGGIIAGAAAVFAAAPASAAAFDVGAIVSASDAVSKAVMVSLLLASGAAVALAAAKVLARGGLTGGSAFVRGLRWAGPLLGLAGALHVMLTLFIGMARFGGSVPLAVYAPGLAEGVLVLLIGVVSGLVGVVCHAVIAARIDRAILQA